MEKEELIDNLKAYVQTNLELLKLELVERISVVGASLTGNLIIGLVVALFLFFLSLGVGFYLSALMGDNYSGFLILAGIYFLIGFLLVLGRKKRVEKPLRDVIIRKILSKNEQ
jgi:hypothetical protein